MPMRIHYSRHTYTDCPYSIALSWISPLPLPLPFLPLPMKIPMGIPIPTETGPSQLI